MVAYYFGKNPTRRTRVIDKKGYRMQPDVSIIVPIFNTEKYLEQCLDSIRRQTHENIEVICVDDGCTDGSASIIDAAASEVQRIKVIH